MYSDHFVQTANAVPEDQNFRDYQETSCETYGLIGNNPRMQQIWETICATASSDASVLIEGESGTGKEVIARAFHSESKRSSGPFISINCAAIPQELIESELFGCVRGAFTGAANGRRGLIEGAEGGTLFLDEIGEMPPPLQAKLLRVLQERSLRRLGGVQEIQVDFRLICATNRDVDESISDGGLRGDLFYRISTIRIKVPPLRERLDDLSLIVECFAQRHGTKYEKPIVGISEEALRILEAYPWPGNVRELENVIEHAVIFCRNGQIVPENLPEEIRAVPSNGTRSESDGPNLSDLTMQQIERRAIEQALNRTGGNIKRASEILGVHRQTMYRKLKSYGILTTLDRRGMHRAKTSASCRSTPDGSSVPSEPKFIFTW